MSNQDNRDEGPRQSGQPQRSRFQQPGGKPPVTSSPAPRGIDGTAGSAPEIRASADTEPTRSTTVKVNTSVIPAPDPLERLFPPEVMLVAYHPLPMIDRLRDLYDQAGLDSAGLPTRWEMGLTLAIASAEVWDQVQAALSHSLQSLLPIEIQAITVTPTVWDRQLYQVGWTMAPDSLDRIRDAQAAILSAFQPLVPTVALTPPDSVITVANHVPALAFPTLIAAMQHNFVPFTWLMDAVMLSTRD